jgi:DHA2 family multidrug resistance protein
VVVLDITIANGGAPYLGRAGGFAHAGDMVLTSYAVAEAICVPLTGWLARTFGAVRVFLMALAGFGLFSMLCGVSTTLPALIAFRVARACAADRSCR